MQIHSGAQRAQSRGAARARRGFDGIDAEDPSGAMSLFVSTSGDEGDRTMELLERLELGECRTTLGTSVMSPQSRLRSWQECYVLQEDKTKFYMVSVSVWGSVWVG